MSKLLHELWLQYHIVMAIYTSCKMSILLCMPESIWNRANVSPADWIGILEIEISLSGDKPTQENCLLWLERFGLFTDRFAISRLKKQKLCAVSLSEIQERIIKTIISNVSLVSCIEYFEEAAYRSLKFYIPEGNPDSVRMQSRPEGFYQATRYSISEPGRIIRSIFNIYRNPAQFEKLSGFADNLSISNIHRPSKKNLKKMVSNVLRFREIRFIDRESGDFYQIVSHGFVFANRQCFVAIGSSFETRRRVPDESLNMQDIEHVQSAYYIFDDDNDANRIRGIKPTFLRHEGNPSAGIIELNRVVPSKTKVWSRISENPEFEIGVFEPKEIDKDLIDRLSVFADPEFQTLRVKSTSRKLPY